jgi:multicomponent Na+:H+ antiporter subunit A
MIASRSPIVRLGIRAASPLAIVIGCYLLFAGHNNPGGGFAAGLVFGAVVTLRTVAGMQRPTHATAMVASGIVVVSVVAIAPLFWGDELLDQKVLSVKMPLLGTIKSGSALPFDLGVTAIVVGLVVALLDGLAATTLSAAPRLAPVTDPRGSEGVQP